MEIKDTLLTPKTSFSMKANLNNREKDMQKLWNDNNVYQQRLELNKSKEKFILLDGPPYANGNLHIGHALNKILKDFIWRYRSMDGYNAEVIIGWDTHGLPIENALLKKSKVKVNELSTNEFRDLCLDYAKKQVAIQKEEFLRFGLLTDGKETYQTFTKDYEAEQIRVFNKMVSRDMIYKGLKPVYWSPTSQSALAEAEIEYQDKMSPAIYVGFDILEHDVLKDTKAVIWTTTPWTIPANQGIAVNKDLEYSQIEVDGKNYLLATVLIPNFLSDIEKEEYKELNTFKGLDLEYVKLQHPLFDQQSFIMLADHVTDDAGTGCVHTAPGHGEDDFLLTQNYDIEVISVVNAKGVMTEEAKQFAGIFYEDANKVIGEALEANGSLINLKFIKHSYPHDWRTKKPIIFRATNQWFASIDAVKEDLLRELKAVDWYNPWGEVRLTNMIKDRKDWCISRQRKWGVPIPIIYNEDESPILDSEVIEHVASLFEEYGSNVWFEKDAIDLLPQGYTNTLSPNNKFTKETDIMDVWFDSGVAHSAICKNRLGSFEADLISEGSDQYRGWFNSMLITGVIAQGKSPYKSVVSHGMVVDDKGNKMSKSIGNVVEPSKVINAHGADILRLWVAQVDYQADVKISDDIIKQVAETYRKYRNALRFMLGNLVHNDQTIFEFDQLEEVDKYILIRLNEVLKSSLENYKNLEYKRMVDDINNFITNELSAFYFDFIKDILYINDVKDTRRQKIEYVLDQILNTLLLLMTPILPHTTNEAYQNYKDSEKEFIFLQDMPKVKEYNQATSIKEKFTQFLDFKEEVNKEIENAREKKIIGKSLEAKLVINAKEDIYNLLEQIDDKELLFIVSSLEISKADKTTIEVLKYSDYRCERCWKYFEEEELTEQHMCSTCQETYNNLEVN